MQTMKRRNWTAKAAIMRKGGVHEKSNKAKRQMDKQSFKRKLKLGAEQFGSFYGLMKSTLSRVFYQLIFKIKLLSNLS